MSRFLETMTGSNRFVLSYTVIFIGATGSAPSALTMMVTGGSRGLAQRTAHEGGVSPPQVTRGGPGRAVLGGDVRSHKTGQEGAQCVPMTGGNERIPVFEGNAER